MDDDDYAYGSRSRSFYYPARANQSEVRAQRALTQPIHLLEVEHEGYKQWKLKIEGSTGNEYELLLTNSGCSCTCPDFSKRLQDCKHIKFVVLRILRKRECPRKIVLTDEMEDELNLKFDRDVFIDLAKSMENALHITEPGKKVKQQQQARGAEEESADSDCLICFECLLVECLQCSTCGKGFHSNCLRVWFKHNHSCPACRQKPFTIKAQKQA